METQSAADLFMVLEFGGRETATQWFLGSFIPQLFIVILILASQMGHFQCQAGASSVRLRLVPGRHARPEARSSGDGEIATPSCSTLAIRAGNRLGFLAAIGALIGSPEGISMEVHMRWWSDEPGILEGLPKMFGFCVIDMSDILLDDLRWSQICHDCHVAVCQNPGTQ